MFWVYVDPSLDGTMKGDYEAYVNYIQGVIIDHPDREEIEGDVLMEFAHGCGIGWQQRRRPAACHANCPCGNTKRGTE